MLDCSLFLSNTYCTIDKTYRAVIGANEALGEQKYHIVGGSAGSVSPCEFAFISGSTTISLLLSLTTFSCVSRLVLPGRAKWYYWGKQVWFGCRSNSPDRNGVA